MELANPTSKLLVIVKIRKAMSGLPPITACVQLLRMTRMTFFHGIPDQVTILIIFWDGMKPRVVRRIYAVGDMRRKGLLRGQRCGSLVEETKTWCFSSIKHGDFFQHQPTETIMQQSREATE